ncbi:MAG: LysE family translocator [Actinomycetota bacterium]
MPSPATLLTFAAATLVLLILPGPAVMYIVTRSATQGRMAGLVSVAGIHLGTAVHVVAAMVGLSAVLVASATAFTAVKLVGAGYLLWLGLQSLRAATRRPGRRSTTESDDQPPVDARSLRRVFFDGVVLNILNPKTAVFFLSFVPQFVDPRAASPALTIAVLGAVFVCLGIVSDGAFAIAGGWIGQRLRRSPTLRRRTDLVAGTAYLGLGVVTATAGGRTG